MCPSPKFWSYTLEEPLVWIEGLPYKIGMKPLEDGTLAPRPGYLTRVLAKRPQFHDPMQPPLTTEISQYGRRVHYKIKEYAPLVDSSTSKISWWAIFTLSVDGVLGGDSARRSKVLWQVWRLHFVTWYRYHGLHCFCLVFHVHESYQNNNFDRLSNSHFCVYFLSQLLTFKRPHSDASDNLYGALLIAGHFRIPEVCIYFNHKLMRGNRTTKFNTEGAFAPAILIF